MEKLGATSTPVCGEPASQPRSRSSRASSKPVVPTTAWMPWSMQNSQVVHHHVGVGEVDDHLGARGAPAPRWRRPASMRGDQLQVVGRLDRPAHLGAHLAAGTEHTDLRLLVTHTEEPRGRRGTPRPRPPADPPRCRDLLKTGEVQR